MESNGGVNGVQMKAIITNLVELVSDVRLARSRHMSLMRVGDGITASFTETGVEERTRDVRDVLGDGNYIITCRDFSHSQNVEIA